MDLVRKAASDGRPVFSHFLSPELRARALRLAKAQGLFVVPFGGGEDCERVVLAFSEQEQDLQVPICVLRAAFDARFGSPGHRDLLGAILGLGIERKSVGDIRLGDGNAYIAVENSMAQYILDNLDKAGRISLRVKRHEGEMPDAEPGQRAVINVPSLRLDAVLQQAARLPRTKAKLFIEQGLCFVDHLEELRPDYKVEPGQVISLRGKGRIKILDIKGESRKNRLFVEVETHLR